MSLLDWIPGVTAAKHIFNNIGKGFREEGLWGACKVVAKGLSKDTALMIGAAAAAFLIPGGAPASMALLASVGSGVTTATTVAAGMDLFGMADLKSEKAAEKAQQQPQSQPLNA